jgi:hypothetical protein
LPPWSSRLGAVLLAAVALRDVEEAGAVEHEARAEVAAAARLRHLAVDDFDVLHSRIFDRARQPAAEHRAAVAPVPAVGEREVHQAVLGEAGMERDVEQAALAVLLDLRQAGDRLRGGLAVAADDAEPSGALGDEHAPVGQEGQAPGILGALGQHHDPERMPPD